MFRLNESLTPPELDGLLAHAAFLQVDQANEPAIKLYRRFGFTPRYGYWQRVQAEK